MVHYLLEVLPQHLLIVHMICEQQDRIQLTIKVILQVLQDISHLKRLL